MKLFHLSLRNLLHRPSDSLLTLILFTLGVGMIVLLFSVNRQLEENLERSQLGIDLVIGAKGSPLQLVLSSIYHVDVPTGNISLEESRPFLNPQHPLISRAVPLALGDSYRGFRIVGTDSSFNSLYGLQLREGEEWNVDFEATLGSEAAAGLGLRTGDTFSSVHGFEEGPGLEHDHAHFRVTGIYEASGTVADRLILTSIPSIWKVHSHSLAEAEEEITSMLIKLRHRTSVQSLNLLRNINQNTGLMAASPSYEMSKLMSMVESGTEAIRAIALVIVLVSALSIFLSMLKSMRERKYELALIRVMGASPFQLFLLIVFEAVMLAIAGAVLGWIGGHLGMELLADRLRESYGYPFSGWKVFWEEGIVLILALVIGVVAALIPAIQAGRTDIHHTIKEI